LADTNRRHNLELALPAQERKHHADDIGRSEPLHAHGDASERIDVGIL
jgi:hypothetical protein